MTCCSGARWAAPLLFFLALALGACGGSGKDTPIADRKVRVVTTTSMLADLAREIGGDRVEVEGLMGPGVDPHLYRPRESDVARLTEADMVIYNGLELEGKMGEALEQIESLGVSAEPVAGNARSSRLLRPEEFEGSFDPHVWMDVTLWRDVAEGVADVLSGADTTNAEVYAANLAAYDARLQELDEYVRERVQDVPEDKRVIVTAHDAFNYFGQAYGFEVRGLQGLSTATEAGTADVQELAAFVADNQIPAMFVETSVSDRSINAVLEAVRARGGSVEIGGSLFSDSLGDPGTPEGTYEGMIRHNVETIVKALSGGASPPVAARVEL